MGDETFAELAARVQRVDLSGESDAELIERTQEWVATRLVVPVEAGVLLAELRRRGWTYIELEREVDLNRRSVLRWSDPFVRTAG